MDLILDLYSLWESKNTNHPQKVINDLGITYKQAIPQSLGDQWWFIGCENIPEDLPAYIKKTTINPKYY